MTRNEDLRQFGFYRIHNIVWDKFELSMEATALYDYCCRYADNEYGNMRLSLKHFMTKFSCGHPKASRAKAELITKGLIDIKGLHDDGSFNIILLNPKEYMTDITVGCDEQHMGVCQISQGGVTDITPIKTYDKDLIKKTTKSLAGPRPAVKRIKSPEQIAKDTEITNQLTDLLEFCKSENYPVNPDRKFTGIMIAALKREGPDRVKKAIRNYLADVKTNGKFAGSFETLFYNPGRMAKYANIQEEKKIESWRDHYANK